jgi:hypothetical protein
MAGLPPWKSFLASMEVLSINHTELTKQKNTFITSVYPSLDMGFRTQTTVVLRDMDTSRMVPGKPSPTWQVPVSNTPWQRAHTCTLPGWHIGEVHVGWYDHSDASFSTLQKTKDKSWFPDIPQQRCNWIGECSTMDRMTDSLLYLGQCDPFCLPCYSSASTQHEHSHPGQRTCT